MKEMWQKIDEWIFMADIRREFTFLGKITIYPFIWVVCWFMVLIFIPFIPIVWLSEKIEMPQVGEKLKEAKYFIRGLFIAKGY
jgi:hypothetical protein